MQAQAPACCNPRNDTPNRKRKIELIARGRRIANLVPFADFDFMGAELIFRSRHILRMSTQVVNAEAEIAVVTKISRLKGNVARHGRDLPLAIVHEAISASIGLIAASITRRP